MEKSDNRLECRIEYCYDVKLFFIFMMINVEMAEKHNHVVWLNILIHIK